MLIPDGFAQVNYFYEVATWPYAPENTHGIDVSSFSSTDGDLADLLISAWTNFMMAYMTDDVTLTGIRIKFGPNATGRIYDATSGFVGDEDGLTTQPAECFLIKKNTALGGRQGRGRFYLPGMRSALLTPSGLWDTALPTAMQTKATEWGAALILDDVTPVLLHGAAGPDTTPEVITSYAADARVATQRRRNRR